MKRIVSSGFTLIELLVVISIIGLLSSVVLASLNSARLKAKDAAIIQSMVSLRGLYEQSYMGKGDYSDWQFNGMITVGDCAASLFEPINYYYYCTTSGSTCGNMYASAINVANPQAEKVCQGILTTAGGSTIDSKPTFAMGVAMNTPGGTKNHYSIAAYLPWKKKYFCVGSGGTSDTADSYENGVAPYLSTAPLGCFRNP